MFRIAICDDEPLFTEALRDTCEGGLRAAGIPFVIEVYNDTLGVLDCLRNPPFFDVVLLDIQMPGVNGIKLAEEIRKTDERVVIIFISASREFALYGYAVQAYHYLVKPIDDKQVIDLLVGLYTKFFHKQYICIKNGERDLRVAVQEIVYLETYVRRVRVVTQTGVLYFSGKLVELLEMLPPLLFVRCHQSFAVNIRCIRELTRTVALMEQDKRVPVSRTYLQDVKALMLKDIRDS